MTKRYMIECSLGLLIVLIVAAILHPTVVTVMGNGGFPASARLQQIALTYSAYFNGSLTPRTLQLPPGSNTQDAAFFLAKHAGLNDASLYYIPSDLLVPSPLPQVIITGDVRDAGAPDLDFAHSTVSFVIAANVSPSAPSTTTPIAWERGLQPNGTWSPDSPWQGAGGHIAFLDGHVLWFDKLDASNTTSSLVKYGTSIPTANITEALPPGAVILSAEPRHGAK
jgi:prepilin-type processing-associated H-X9-DG protein